VKTELHVLVDDFRTFKWCSVTLRNYDEAQAWLNAHHAEVTHLYLDYDLKEPAKANKCGLVLLRYLLDELGARIPNIQVITSDVMGKERMVDLLKGAGYETSDDFNYVFRVVKI